MRVLAVEDQPKMLRLLQHGLQDEGMVADVSENGEDALWMSGRASYDAIVLDVMLPGIDGFETCRRLRACGISAPVLMLSARGTLEDRVAGLDNGADDYLAKPFAFAELVARIRAPARRGEALSWTQPLEVPRAESRARSDPDYNLPGMGEPAMVEAKQGRTSFLISQEV